MGFPKTPWQKGGMMKVEKKIPKEQVISSIARQLIKARSAAVSAPSKKK
jgi:signal recognition particle subunit SEC65